MQYSVLIAETHCVDAYETENFFFHSEIIVSKSCNLQAYIVHIVTDVVESHFVSMCQAYLVPIVTGVASLPSPPYSLLLGLCKNSLRDFFCNNLF